MDGQRGQYLKFSRFLMSSYERVKTSGVLCARIRAAFGHAPGVGLQKEGSPSGAGGVEGKTRRPFAGVQGP